MSIVNAELPGAKVLDLFSGSGALGLESLSRGAAVAHFVENAARSLAAIEGNVETLGAGEKAVIHRADALQFIDALGAETFDVAFADPPYDKGLATEVAKRWLERPFASLLGIEHRRDERLPGSDDRRTYGGSVISFYGLSS
jgi:16S rRNA (guanine966-N2)-methyltransferase